MAFDAAFAKTIGSLITAFGTPVTVSRIGTQLFKTAAAFVNIKTVVDTTFGDSMIAKVNNGQAECYIGASKIAPAPGDTLVGKGRSYSVLEVETYQPALVVLAYKLVLE